MSARILSYAESVDDAGRALLLAARGVRSSEEQAELISITERVGQAAVQACARENKVEALVGSALESCLGSALDSGWRNLVRENELRVRTLVDQVAVVVEHLEGHGCRTAAIEGGGALLATETPFGAYGSGDFDLLVDDAAWPRVPALLGSLGYQPRDRRSRPTHRVEYLRRVGEAEEWIEIGTRPFDRMWVPLELEDRAQVWLARRVPARATPGLSVLEASDAVALCLLHASMHSYVRSPGLRLYVDIDRLVRENAVDWAHVIGEIELIGARTRAFVSMCMVRALLGTPIPDHAVAALYPGRARWDALRRLLEHDGVIANGERKLTGARAVALDALIHEGGPARWLRSVCMPPEAWLRDHFERDPSQAWGVPRLHIERFRLLATRWRKEVG